MQHFVFKKPFIQIEGIPAKDFRQQKINILDFSAVIFTSKTGIDHFFRICNELRIVVPDGSGGGTVCISS